MRICVCNCYYIFSTSKKLRPALILDGIPNSALHTVTDCMLAVFSKRSAMRGGGDVVYASVTLVQSNHFSSSDRNRRICHTPVVISYHYDSFYPFVISPTHISRHPSPSSLIRPCNHFFPRGLLFWVNPKQTMRGGGCCISINNID